MGNEQSVVADESLATKDVAQIEYSDDASDQGGAAVALPGKSFRSKSVVHPTEHSKAMSMSQIGSMLTSFSRSRAHSIVTKNEDPEDDDDDADEKTVAARQRNEDDGDISAANLLQSAATGLLLRRTLAPEQLACGGCDAILSRHDPDAAPPDVAHAQCAVPISCADSLVADEVGGPDEANTGIGRGDDLDALLMGHGSNEGVTASNNSARFVRQSALAVNEIFRSSANPKAVPEGEEDEAALQQFIARHSSKPNPKEPRNVAESLAADGNGVPHSSILLLDRASDAQVISDGKSLIELFTKLATRRPDGSAASLAD